MSFSLRLWWESGYRAGEPGWLTPPQAPGECTGRYDRKAGINSTVVIKRLNTPIPTA
jgi:hypothetical protein